MVGKGREELLSFPAGVLSSLSWSPAHKWSRVRGTTLLQLEGVDTVVWD